jgi:alpha-1,2-mannosyltransferase
MNRLSRQLQRMLHSPTSSDLFLLIGFAIVIASLFWWVSSPRQLFSDYLKGYDAAGRAVLSGYPGLMPLYDGLLFVNLPIIAWLFTPFAWAGDPAYASRAYFAFGLACSIGACLSLIHLSSPAAARRAWLVVPLFIVNGPLIYSLKEGNSSHIILFILCLSLLFVQKERFVPTGALIGFCAIIKMPLVLLALVFVVNRKWAGLAAMLAVPAVALATSLVAAGFEPVLSWYRSIVVPFSQGAVAAYNVQTADAFILRLIFGAEHLRNYLPLPRSDWHEFLRTTIIIVQLVLFFYASRRARFSDLDHSAIFTDFSIVLLISLLISPLSWSHYYCYLLIPWGLQLGGRLNFRESSTVSMFFGLSIALGSMPVLKSTTSLLYGELASRTIVSTPFAAAVLLLAGLLWGAVHTRPAGCGSKSLSDTPAVELSKSAT